eukprot:IDg16751t1
MCERGVVAQGLGRGKREKVSSVTTPKITVRSDSGSGTNRRGPHTRVIPDASRVRRQALRLPQRLMSTRAGTTTTVLRVGGSDDRGQTEDHCQSHRRDQIIRMPEEFTV